MKKLILALAFLSLTNASDDFLATLTKGALSDKSLGVKLLTVDEAKKVVGGYRPYTICWYTYTHTMPIKNNYNANTRPQTSHQTLYSNAFCKYSVRC